MHFSNMAANTIKTVLKYGSKYNQNKPQTLKLTVANCEVIVFWLHKYQRQSISLKQPGWLWSFTQSNFHGGTTMNMKEKEKETSLQLGKRIPRRAIFNVQYSISNIQYSIFNIQYPIFNVQYHNITFEWVGQVYSFESKCQGERGQVGKGQIMTDYNVS